MNGSSGFIELTYAAAKLLAMSSFLACIILGLAWIAAKALKDYSAAMRHDIWLVSLAAVALSPVWSLVALNYPVFVPVRTVVFELNQLPGFMRFAGSDIAAASEAAAIGWTEFMVIGLVGMWVLGLLVCVLRLAAAQRRTREMVKSAMPLKSPVAGLASVIPVLNSDRMRVPALIGIFRPVIVLPSAIAASTDKEGLGAIIRHELAHYDRRDHWGLPLQTAIGCIFFFHPLVRYALTHLALERESACDEAVLKTGISQETYKEIILTVAEHGDLEGEGYSLAFSSARNLLTKRINRIMNNKFKSLSRAGRYSLVTGVALLLAVAVWFASPSGISGAEPPHSGFGESATKDDEETFRKLYEEIKTIMLKGDREGFERLLADDYAADSPHGATLTKKQVVDTHIHAQTGDARLENVDFTKFKVRISGSTAVVSYVAEMSGTNKGSKFTHRARITDFWEKRDGRWLSTKSTFASGDDDKGHKPPFPH